jgi:alpha-tubulin suppressor-like RCC1 family protein
MKTLKHFIRTLLPSATALTVFSVTQSSASAATVNAVWNSAADIPVTASGYTATGNTLSFALNFAPATGTDLMVVKNTALDFITGTFANLAQGQPVALSYGGVTYRFAANYYGGSGNDLVLVWASNRAFAWGNNVNGQMGDGTQTTRLVPVPVTATGILAGKPVAAVAVGGYHSLALCSDGTLAACGANSRGQLGDGTTTARTLPVAVSTAPGVSALYGKTVVAVAAGARHNLALCSDGTIAAWGLNSFGQVGNNTTNNALLPVPVDNAPGISALYGKTVVAVAAGMDHSLALCSDGTVVAWGYNCFGQLGNNTTNNSLVPAAINSAPGISELYGRTVVAIAAGGYHNQALCSDRTLVGWGWNYYGQVGDCKASGSQSLVPVVANTNAGVSALYGKTLVGIATGLDHSLAVCSDGTVVAWGLNNYGQLGDNQASGLASIYPLLVNTTPGVSALYGRTVIAISAGADHSLALCSDGTVAAWGYNPIGQVGDNTTVNRLIPVAVNSGPLASGQRFARVSTGQYANHNLAVVAAPPASHVTPVGAKNASDGSFGFTFTNTPGAFFSVFGAINPALPFSNWTPLIGLTEALPGQFQFTDPQASNNPQRFYRIQSP